MPKIATYKYKGKIKAKFPLKKNHYYWITAKHLEEIVEQLHKEIEKANTVTNYNHSEKEN